MSFAHVQTLHTLLRGVDGAVEDVERRVKSCQLALQAAQAAFDAAEQERRTLIRSRGNLQRAIKEARKTLDCTSALPNEIISLIFSNVAAHGRPRPATLAEVFVYEESIIDWARATLPRNLRLVCKRWSDVALATPELWTYIAVAAHLPAIARRRKGLVKYLALQLERSRTLPLSVVVDAEFGYKDGILGGRRGRNDAVDLQSQLLRSAFDILVTEDSVARIRILKIQGGPPTSDPDTLVWIPGHGQNNIRDLTMGMLRLPTPRLEEAYIVMNPDNLDAWEPWPTGSLSSALPPFLPVAPRLHTLRILRFPLMCYPPHPGLPSLELLSVMFNCVQKSHLLGMLALCPALRELHTSITDLHDDAPPTVSQPVTLPARTLDIDYEESSHAFLSEVTLPNVCSLKIRPSMLFDGLNLQVKFASTLTNIYFAPSENIDPDEVPYELLGSLTLIDDASFGTDVELRKLTELLCREDPIWPHLKHLTIRSELTRDDNAELVRLALHRSPQNVDALSEKVEALQTITVRRNEVANWAIAQLRIALGADGVILIP